MNLPAVKGKASTIVRPSFTAAEIAAVRGENPQKLHALVPARCYYDQDIYDFEVERILKRHWLAVGRWDWAEKPGDYFTLSMFGEPLIIVRDRHGTLHCLVNACRHRWARVVDEGSGNKTVFMCPYHRWTYNLDGTLRAISRDSIPGFSKENCALPSIRLELWEGTIFINFDSHAAPLAPQLVGLEPLIGRFNLGAMRTVGRVNYETTWNYKYSFETGYEAYHHCGIHNERLEKYAPPEVHDQIAFGTIWGAYGGHFPKEVDTLQNRFPLGIPPWMTEAEANEPDRRRSIFVGIYQSLITFIQPHQISMITTEHMSVDRNHASTHISIAPWALERKENADRIGAMARSMQEVQDEDTYGCEVLQKGVRSSYNDRSVIHPRFEPQLSHYHEWLLNQYLTA